ncbi:MAG: pyruvate carboxyltransferase [Desulfocapsa sp.]|nr:pyruvate carboxyltransferase [Desulfocapsa sp.]
MEKYKRSPVKIIDTTLREGEQSPGVFFDHSLKKRIIQGLTGLGIDEIEIGVASEKHGDLGPLTEHIHREHPHQDFSLWCRCHKADISYAASLRPTCIALSIPASDLHLEKKLGKDREWAVRQLKHSIHQAHTEGISRVSVGLEDASRADSGFVRKLARVAEESGAFRLRLADTVGIATPVTIIRMLEALKGLKMELGVHCHNDFGMATANTITALDHGALWGDVTLLGLGERAGNSRLEEVIAFLSLQKKTETYTLQGLPELSRMVAGESGQEIEPTRPIIGKNIFSCETGIHLQGIMADPSTYEPYAPELVGASRKLLIGRMAGQRSIAATLARLGLPLPDESRLTRLTRQIRSLAAREERSLPDHEIRKLAIGP